MSVQPFDIRIPDEDVADLNRRLDRTRWPDEVDNADWRYGANLGFMRALTAYWRNGFDWRAQEARLNRVPQFRVQIDGVDVHFAQLKGRGPDPLPIVLTHGWPSSFAELLPLAERLADPSAHSGDPADAFDVVVPSMPGYGFSGRPAAPGMTADVTAALWARLMTEVLGYDRFVAHGGDIGARVTNRLGRSYGDRVPAIHVMAVPKAQLDKITDVTPEERAWLDVGDEWERDEGAYSHQQKTRPQTLAFGLNDSPVGLAAWIVEKWRAWSECGGDLESRFSKDELLTQVAIYWFTQTAASSVRMYWEHAHAAPWELGRIDTPARLFLTTEPVDLAPRSWAERFYAELSYGRAPRGGHFLAGEEPDLLAQDIRDWFCRFR
jgi:microsomal epoxide hydrolase